MTNTSERYPATSYDRDLHDWTVTAESVNQKEIGKELATAEAFEIPYFSGPLTKQLPDGSDGELIGAVSVVWSRTVQEDGSRKVLGWYETGRG